MMCALGSLVVRRREHEMIVATAGRGVLVWEDVGLRGGGMDVHAVRIRGKLRIPLACGDTPSTAWK